MKKHFLICCLFLLVTTDLFGKSNWREIDIQPLISKKSDVESRFGKSTDKCDCLYETSSFRLKVTYSQETCDDGWKVPLDTVLYVQISPKKEETLSQEIIQDKTFFKWRTDTFNQSFTSPQKGITVMTNWERKIERIGFFPKGELVKQKRCLQSPQFNPMNGVYSPSLSYFIEDWHMTLGEIVNLSSQFTSMKESKLYVFVYFPTDMSKKTQRNWINKINLNFGKYLKEKKNKTFITNGGKRDKMQIEAFIIPENYPPPTPIPQN